VRHVHHGAFQQARQDRVFADVIGDVLASNFGRLLVLDVAAFLILWAIRPALRSGMLWPGIVLGVALAAVDARLDPESVHPPRLYPPHAAREPPGVPQLGLLLATCPQPAPHTAL